MKQEFDIKNRILKNGQPLSPELYTWDAETRTFSTDESGLVIDFLGIDNCTFKTGYNCTFRTSSDCTFTTGGGCTFTTGSDCTFTTGRDCTFRTSSDCTFTTGSSCTFTTSDCCVIIRRDLFDVIVIEKGATIELFPYGQKGYLVNGIVSEKKQ